MPPFCAHKASQHARQNASSQAASCEARGQRNGQWPRRRASHASHAGPGKGGPLPINNGWADRAGHAQLFSNRRPIWRRAWQPCREAEASSDGPLAEERELQAWTICQSLIQPPNGCAIRPQVRIGASLPSGRRHTQSANWVADWSGCGLVERAGVFTSTTHFSLLYPTYRPTFLPSTFILPAARPSLSRRPSLCSFALWCWLASALTVRPGVLQPFRCVASPCNFHPRLGAPRPRHLWCWCARRGAAHHCHPGQPLPAPPPLCVCARALPVSVVAVCAAHCSLLAARPSPAAR